MAYNVSKVFSAFLDSKDLKYETLDSEGNVFCLSYKLDNTKIRILILFDDDESVQVRGGSFITIPTEKIDKMYKYINKCNDQFRWVKFSIDNDGDAFTTIDAVIELETCAEEIYQLIQRTASIVDDAYPILMKGLWGED